MDAMQFQIHMGDPSDHALLLQMLDTWRRLTCVSVRLSDWSPDRDEEPDLLIWDLDTGMLPPASSGSALIFCVSCSQAAISG